MPDSTPAGNFTANELSKLTAELAKVREELAKERQDFLKLQDAVHKWLERCTSSIEVTEEDHKASVASLQASPIKPEPDEVAGGWLYVKAKAIERADGGVQVYLRDEHDQTEEDIYARVEIYYQKEPHRG